MAGNYPDYTSYRLAYDRDGTVLLRVFESGAGTTEFANSNLVLINDLGTEDSMVWGSQAQNHWMVFMFPELRDIDAYVLYYGGDTISRGISSSANTTNGFDGTWTTHVAGVVNTVANVPAMRTVQTISALGVRALRFGIGSGAGHAMYSVHLFGEPSTGENPDRLAIWHPTLDQQLGPAALDYGNIPRGSTEDRTFRVKNLSSVYTANSVRVAMETLTDVSPSIPGQYTLSIGGGSYLAQQTISSIAPGAISAVITQRRITPSNAVLGLHEARVFAEALSWS